MLKIGLTGGIGSGKSTVAKRFASLGAAIIDADEIARELVAPGQQVLHDIVTEFGTEVITAKGELDRSKLRQLIFAEPQRRKILEALLHPLIRAEMQHRADNTRTPYCVLCIPLLVETRQTDMVDRVLVIDSPEKLQYRRIKQRDGLPDTEIKAILVAQAKPEDRLAVADDIIVNDGSEEDLYHQIDRLHKKYLQMAS